MNGEREMKEDDDEEREEGRENDGSYTSAIIGAPKILQIMGILVSACCKGVQRLGCVY